MKTYTNSIGNEVKIFAETFEQEAMEQVKKLAEYPPYQKAKIRIMPDAHAGKGCTIGTAIKITDAVTPNLVGVDLNCGMLVVKLLFDRIDFPLLDSAIRLHVPSGRNIHSTPFDFPELEKLRCKSHVNLDRAYRSIGTLGGGNHFIEVDYSAKTGDYYLVIHTGSRHLGVEICKYYQKIAESRKTDWQNKITETIAKLKAEGREKEIQNAIINIPRDTPDKELAHLTGEDMADYLHDMGIVERYALTNRRRIAETIFKYSNLVGSEDYFTTLHNYINVRDMILRKGAVSANQGERLIIPLNMRDGSLICIGKGNEDWNYSAPHGAGRLMSRAKARETLSLNAYKEVMQGIYTTSVNDETIDEAPMAYKAKDEILRAIEPTVEVLDIIQPVYNFKANN